MQTQNHSVPNVDAVLFVMAEPVSYTHLDVYKRQGMLFKEELCVCDIAFLLDMTHSAVSHQLSVLRQNRLIKYRRSGKNVFYSLDDAHIQQIYDAGLAHILEH